MSENLVLSSLQTSQSMDLCFPIKKTKGRQKIEMKKIEKRSNLMVTFSKRKQGVFKKASELSVLCGSEIAVIMQSPGDKIYSFGTPSVESVLYRLYGCMTTDEDYEVRKSISHSRVDDCDAERRLWKEKETEMNNDDFWWNKDVQCMYDVEDLEEYMGRLEGFGSCFLKKADELKLQSQSDSLPRLISIEEGDGFEDLGYLLEGLEHNMVSDSANATSVSSSNNTIAQNAVTYGLNLEDRGVEDDSVDLENLLGYDFGKLLEGLEEKYFSDAPCSFSDPSVDNVESCGLFVLENKHSCDMDAIFKCLDDENLSDVSGSFSSLREEQSFGLTDEDSSYLDNFLKNLL